MVLFSVWPSPHRKGIAMSNWNRVLTCCAFGIWTMSFSTALQAEVPNQSPENLKKNATHIVTGKVLKMTEKSTKSANYDDIAGFCEITVTALEKGEGIETGKLVKARYSKRYWIGKGDPPPGSSGHRGLPKKDETVRVYLSKAKDGGYDVILPNGFEKMTPEGK